MIEAEQLAELLPDNFDRYPLWQMDIGKLSGKNIEVKGREEVNKLLQEGWILLHIYTLKYREDDTWVERPMAILGKPRSLKKNLKTSKSSTFIKIP